MADYLQTYQAIFNYGEVGESLEGLRDSQIAQQSAKELKDFYITEMGTLRVAKDYDDTNILTDNGNPIIARRNTKYDFFLVFTNYWIHSINKDTLDVIATIGTDGRRINEFSNISIFNNFFFIKYEDKTIDVYAFKENGTLGKTNFFNTLKKPFSVKIDVSMDVYKIFKQTDGTLRPELLATYPEKVKLESSSDDKIKLRDTSVVLDRVYIQYKSLVSKDQIDGATEGMVFAVLKNYQNPEGTDMKYYLGNNEVVLEGMTDDAKYGSKYFTSFNLTGINGEFMFGKLEDFTADKTKVMDVAEFQSRLCIATEDKLYFSKILEYTDFIPELNDSGGFFIKPSTIDGHQVQVVKLTVGNGLYVSCDEGSLVLGWGSSISSTNLSSVKIAGNSPCSTLGLVIEDIFYYVDKTNILRAIIPNFSSGVIQFSNVLVESYDYGMSGKGIKCISKAQMNEDSVLIVTPQEYTGYVWIYSFIKSERMFRRFKISMPKDESKEHCPVLGLNNDILYQTTYKKITKRNKETCYLILNLPFVKTETRGTYLNDFLMQYKRMVFNMLGNKASMKSLQINGYPIQKLSTTTGNYNVWDFMGSIPIIDTKITLTTNKTDDIIELRGMNNFFG